MYRTAVLLCLTTTLSIAEDLGAQCASEKAADKDNSAAEDTAGESSCGCNAGRNTLVKPAKTEGRTETADKETTPTEVSDTSRTFRNISDTACTDEPFYEGYRVGCIAHYRDEYSGKVDAGMVLIGGGSFTMGQSFVGDAERRIGSNDPGLAVRFKYNTIHGVNKHDAEHPTFPETVASFYMDRTEVTNGQFHEFVEATDYLTDAELFNWSFVLEPFLDPKLLESDPPLVPSAPWWRSIEGTSWKHPEGPGSSVEHLPVWHGKPTEGVPDRPEGTRWAHPASHISWRDAYNFCRWRGKRLPLEKEWEYAARGGKDQEIFPWGDRLYLDTVHRSNVWQGDLPGFVNTAEDGYRGTAATASYPPNAFGLYEMTGNIWEWVEDDFSRGEKQAVQERSETQGGSNASPRVSHKTKRGGSHMCHAGYVVGIL